MTSHLFFFWFTVTAGPPVAPEFVEVQVVMSVSHQSVLQLSRNQLQAITDESVLGVEP